MAGTRKIYQPIFIRLNAGLGAITTSIVMMHETKTLNFGYNWSALFSIVLAIGITY